MLSQAQFEWAVKTQGPSLLAWLVFLCRGNHPEAEDLLQKTFVDVWRARAQYDGRPLEPWLRGFAWNRLRVERRATLRRHRLKSSVEAEPMGPSSSLEEAPAAPALRTCLEKLPPLDRRIVHLAYGLEDSESPHPLTDAAVAAHISSPETPWRPERVKTRRHRALSALRTCLEQAGQKSCFPEWPSEVPMHPPRSEQHPSLLRLLAMIEADPAEAAMLEATQPLAHPILDCPSCSQTLDAAFELERTLFEHGFRARAPSGEPAPALPAALEQALLRIPVEETMRETYQQVAPLAPANRGFPRAWQLLLATAAAGLLATLLPRSGIEPAATPAVQARGPLEAPVLPVVEVVIQAEGASEGERVLLEQQGPHRWRARVPRASLVQLHLREQGPEGSGMVTVGCEWPGHGALPLDRTGTTRWSGTLREISTPIGDPLSLRALGLEVGERLLCTLQVTPHRGLPSTTLQLELEGVP